LSKASRSRANQALEGDWVEAETELAAEAAKPQALPAGAASRAGAVSQAFSSDDPAELIATAPIAMLDPVKAGAVIWAMARKLEFNEAQQHSLRRLLIGELEERQAETSEEPGEEDAPPEAPETKTFVIKREPVTVTVEDATKPARETT
jgi:hypothetical protein